MKPWYIEKIEYLSLAILLVGVYFAYLKTDIIIALTFLLLPDLSILGYLINNATGALIYNLFHSFLCPMLLITVGILFDLDLPILMSLSWAVHISLDRMFGYGLKYSDNFKHTT